MTQDPFDALREQMAQVIAIYAHYSSEKLGKDAFNERVMEVLGEVPRHEFVPLELRAYAYADGPLPIGYEKTISQPFMVALMTNLAEIEDGMRVLEVWVPGSAITPLCWRPWGPRCTASKSSMNWRSGQKKTLNIKGLRASNSVSATAPTAGSSTRPMTASWSPRRRS